MRQQKSKNLEQFWRGHLAKLASSGMSMAKYCAQHKLVDHQMSWWKYRLAAMDKKQAETGKPLVKVAVLESAPRSASFFDCQARLALGRGVTVEFTDAADPAWIARLFSNFVGGAP